MVAVARRKSDHEGIELSLGHFDYCAHAREEIANELARGFWKPAVEGHGGESIAGAGDRAGHGTRPARRGAEPCAELGERNSCGQAASDERGPASPGSLRL